jgi:hypothetical protein
MILSYKGAICLVIGVISFFVLFATGLVYFVNSTEVDIVTYKKILDRLGKYPEYDQKVKEVLKDDKLVVGERKDLNSLYAELEKQTLADEMKSKLKKEQTHPKY